jgi:hypothetical protein
MTDALTAFAAAIFAFALAGAMLFCTVGFWAIGALYVLGYLP